jgi:hypothetical protein
VLHAAGVSGSHHPERNVRAEDIWRPAEMKPAEKDADAHGDVLVWSAAKGTVARAKWDSLKREHSHWQRIVSPWGDSEDNTEDIEE